MTETVTATETAVRDLIESGASREHVAAQLVMAGVIVMLANDPEIAAMAAANDLEHFEDGCKNPAFRAKFAAALVTIRDIVAA